MAAQSQYLPLPAPVRLFVTAHGQNYVGMQQFQLRCELVRAAPGAEAVGGDVIAESAGERVFSGDQACAAGESGHPHAQRREQIGDGHRLPHALHESRVVGVQPGPVLLLVPKRDVELGLQSVDRLHERGGALTGACPRRQVLSLPPYQAIDFFDWFDQRYGHALGLSAQKEDIFGRVVCQGGGGTAPTRHWGRLHAG